MIGCVFNPLFLEHGPPGHPENAQRLETIVERLGASSQWGQLHHLEFGPATVEQVSWVHDPHYVEYVRRLSQSGGGALDPETEATEQTYAAAMLAAGGCIRATEALMKGQVEAALCLVRPPGHHAAVGQARGFCFFNNIAIATEAARRGGASRVAIVDFDAHHGNGTQEIFYHRGDVLYISLHQSPLYPGTGTVDEVGVDEGAGATINIPVPEDTRDQHYWRACEELIGPALNDFAPDIILVSAGYDPHWKDPLTGLALTAAGFYQMTHFALQSARHLCQGRLGLILEGGYHLPSLALSVQNTLLALAEEPGLEEEESPPPLHSVQAERINQYLDHAITTHRTRLNLAPA